MDSKTEFVRRRELCRRLAISRSQSYILQERGMLPEPRRLGTRCVLWKWSDVVERIEAVTT